MTRITSILFGGVGLLLLGVVLGYGLEQSWSSEPEISPKFETLAQAYDIVQSEYVEPVALDTLATHSIRGMIQPLDAHSEYLDRERMQYVEETFDGSFQGIGITYDLIEGPREQDTLFVQTVVPGGPSEDAGLRAGDRIIAVNGEEAIGWTHERIRTEFKGPEGSTIQVTIRRPGRPTSMQVTINRDVVPLQTLEAAYMVNDTTGYLRLRRFARTTGRELAEGLRQLKAKGMQRLILDLRGNAGGLMDAAAEVADEFLVEGQQIVSAQSRHRDYAQTEVASTEGAFETGPLIVLVDGHSASASEIVAGAVQDHDRAVLVGRPTYGKGSVQRQFEFEDQSGLRLTVARFHTPSGRLLKSPTDSSTQSVSAEEAVRATRGADTADSSVYLSDAGRKLKGGGGIYPDRRVETERRSSYHRALEEQELMQSFARKWIDARADSLRARWADRPDAFAQHFSLSSTVVPAFIQYAREHGVRLSRDSLTYSLSGRVASEAGTSLDASNPDRHRLSFREFVEAHIASYVGRRLFGTSMWIRVRNTVDPIVTEALHSWETAEAMAARYPID